MNKIISKCKNNAPSLVGRAGVGLLLLVLMPHAAHAQSTWTLDDCIAYALEHNTQVAQSGLQVEDARLQLHTSRYSRLPDLNASIGQSFGFGRSQGRDGSTEDMTSASTSFGIHTSVPLFTGLRIPNQIRADRENMQAAEQRLEAQRREVGIMITTYFLNTLYYKGVMDVAAEQVRTDSMQVERARAMVESGRKAESEVAEAEAALASSVVNLTSAQGNLRMALLDLQQAMNYDGDKVITPATLSEMDTERLADRYLSDGQWMTMGIESHPTLLTAQHQLKASEYQQRIAQSAYYPTLSFSAGYSNSYFHSYDYPNQSLSKQLNLNGSEYLSFSLNIPIFNRFSTRNSVSRAKLNVLNYRLQLDEQRRTLRKQIEQAQVNAVNARERLASAQQAERANELACMYETEKYNAGNATLYTLSQAQQRLLSARNDVIQARCELALRLRILQFYFN